MLYLHNECALRLAVVRFTAAYICSAVDGHGDAGDDILDWLALLIKILQEATVLVSTFNRVISLLFPLIILDWANWCSCMENAKLKVL